jgi:hypothetical protein
MLMGNPFLFSRSLGKVGTILLRCFKYVVAYLLSLRTCYRTPRILTFHANEQLLIQGGILKLVWRTKYTAFVYIEGLGYFLTRNEVALPIHFQERTFTLTAYGFLRKNSRTITLTAMGMPLLPHGALHNYTPSIASINNTQFKPKEYQYQLHNPTLSISYSIKAISLPEL